MHVVLDWVDPVSLVTSTVNSAMFELRWNMKMPSKPRVMRPLLVALLVRCVIGWLCLGDA